MNHNNGDYRLSKPSFSNLPAGKEVLVLISLIIPGDGDPTDVGAAFTNKRSLLSKEKQLFQWSLSITNQNFLLQYLQHFFPSKTPKSVR
jgi:hypothetical protein